MTFPRKCHESQTGLLLCNKHLLQLRKDQPLDCVQLKSLPVSVQSGFIRSREGTIAPVNAQGAHCTSSL